MGSVFFKWSGLLLAGFAFQSVEAAEEGIFELAYEPKYCITTPCPQFHVVAIIKGEPQKLAGADLVNIDPKKSAISSFRTIRVTGTYVQEDGVLNITVSEWEGIVREKVEPKAEEQKK